MKHLRKFNENSNRPGPNTGAKSITISQDEVDSFSTESSLQKLIADEKVSVIGDKVYYNDETGRPYKETDRLGGFDPYSASKAAAEIVIDSYRQSFFHPSKYGAH